MSDEIDNEGIHDGFDLVDFPCDYSFKAMCRVKSDSVASKDVVYAIVLQHTTAKRIKSLRSLSSRTGKFESVTITVRLDDRMMLESIYQALADCDEIVMTL